jgi:outer membrane lipoprotein SlyB
MKTRAWSWKILAIGFAVVLLGGCATSPYNAYYATPQPAAVAGAPPPAEPTFLTVGPEDRYYILQVDNRSPFAFGLHEANRVLYKKGYDQVKRQREADFSVNIAIATSARDNPDARAEHLLGGAILGAAAGALIGAAAGAPATGAIAGAAGGGVLGLAAPADSPMLRIDIQTMSFRDGATSSKSVVLDMANVPPYDAPRVVDIQIARMLDTLPAK